MIPKTRTESPSPAAEHPVQVGHDLQDGDGGHAEVVHCLVVLRRGAHDVGVRLHWAVVGLHGHRDQGVHGDVLPDVHARHVVGIGLEHHSPDRGVRGHQREVVPSADLGVLAEHGVPGVDGMTEHPVADNVDGERAVGENDHVVMEEGGGAPPVERTVRALRRPWPPRCTRSTRPRSWAGPSRGG